MRAATEAAIRVIQSRESELKPTSMGLAKMTHRSARVCLNHLNQGKQPIVKGFFLRGLDEIEDCRHLFWQQKAFDTNLVTQATAYRGLQRLSLTGRLFRGPAESASKCVLWQGARFQEGLLTGQPKPSALFRGKAPNCAGMLAGGWRSKLSVTPICSEKATRGFLARVWGRARTAPRERERQEGRKASPSKELPRPTLKRFGWSVGLEYDGKNGLFCSVARLGWQKIGQQIQAGENRQQRTDAKRGAAVKKVIKQGYTAGFKGLGRATGSRGILPVTEGRGDARPAGCGGKGVKQGWQDRRGAEQAAVGRAACLGSRQSLRARPRGLGVGSKRKKAAAQSQFGRTMLEWEKRNRVGNKC